MRSKLLVVLGFACLIGAAWRQTTAQGQAKETPAVPKEVRALLGTYTGSWTMFGVDAKGEVVRRAAWTDVQKVDSPEVKGDRAFVTTLDEMTFAGVNAPPRKFPGKEGYFIKPDGSLGDYFIEANGQVTRMIQLGENVWTYAAPAAPQELTSLGFPAGASGQHVLVKVVTREAGVETHRISRITTVQWKDGAGKERCLQYTSLQGFHKHQP